VNGLECLYRSEGLLHRSSAKPCEAMNLVALVDRDLPLGELTSEEERVVLALKSSMMSDE